ncbi:ROK family transcriptional regulator [Schaalia vaccimaxillae]|uniref:ROK family transcriptional regulator n=1 Tax=Schaalia vaccimaxillae TaxID=183916 RepID=UPI0003B368F4|nr:ROK family transcriptional regulator [Schaalia vaccimaxillae]
MGSTYTAPGSQSSLREANAARIIENVKKYGQITQVELATATGLSSATVSNIVKQLVANNVVRIATTVRSGRRAHLISMASSSGLAVGIHIGRRHMTIEVSDESGDVHADQLLPLPQDHRVDTTLDRAALLVMELTEEVGSSLTDVHAVGVCLPAPVNGKTGELSSIQSQHGGWDEVSIQATLQRRLQVPVLVDNDANAGLIGESRYGNLRGVEDAIYLHMSHSVGAGLLAGGRVHRGHRGRAGEIGHVQVDPQGLICQCGGRGCLKTVVGIDALLEPLRLNHNVNTLSDLVNAARTGDAGCRQVLADAGSTIGKVLGNLAVMHAPTHIVLGGELALTDDLLLTPVQEALKRRPYLDDVTVMTTSLAGRAEVLGALALARDASQSQTPRPSSKTGETDAEHPRSTPAA